MKKLNIKNGFGLINIIIVIALLAVLAIYGSQIGLGYLNQKTLIAATKATLLDLKSDDSATTKKVTSSIFTKISTNNIDLDNNDVLVEKNSTGFSVTVNYVKEIKVNDTMKLVMDLSFTETTP